MKPQTIISIENLSKKYFLGKTNHTTLYETLGNIFKKRNNKKDEFWALKDVNFNVNRGDILGIIGKNGAGKSTLLKVLSRITEPTTGRIELIGRVASLLEVGTGFHPELTGRENIFLNGSILGMKKSEIRANFDKIVDFAGVEKFIDTPVKRYSSGMYVRLAFSVAAHLNSEILIIDEVLSVGDVEFQKKSLGRMNEISEEGRTVIFVSHNMGAIQKLCNRAILLANGQINLDSDLDSVIAKYLNDNQNNSISNKSITDNVFLKNVTIEVSENGFNKNIEIKFKIIKKCPSNRFIDIGIGINNSLALRLITTEHFQFELNRTENNFKVVISNHFLPPSSYSLSLAILIGGYLAYRTENELNFTISEKGISTPSMSLKKDKTGILLPSKIVRSV